MSALDLFGHETTPAPRTNDRPEAAALVEVLRVLRNHPAVAWAERQNTGAASVGGRFIRFGWRGCSDVIGQLRDGRLLAVEVKARGGRARPEQKEFLSLVRRFGGVAFIARNCREVSDALEREGRGALKLHSLWLSRPLVSRTQKKNPPTEIEISIK